MAMPPPEGGPSLFSRMFNPDKRKVAFEDAGGGGGGGGGGGEEDGGDEEDGDDESAGGEGAGEGPSAAEDEEDIQKAFFLRQMRKMQAGVAGGYPVRPMTMRHSLRDIKAEFHRMCAELDEEEANKTMKLVLHWVGQGSEWANMFLGSPLMLNGWSGYFDDELKTGKHDRVLAQLHAKYSRYTQLGPELQLVRAMAVSAFLFHMCQKGGDSVTAWLQQPGFLEAVMRTRSQMQGEASGSVPATGAPAMGVGFAPPAAVPGPAVAQPMRQQPMSRPQAAFIFSQDGTIRPNVGIRTRPFTRVQEVPEEASDSAQSSDDESHPARRGTPSPPPPSVASDDSGLKPLSSERSGKSGRSGRSGKSGRQSNATSNRGRGRGSKRTVQL